MDKSKELQINYYRNQLGIIDFHSQYAPTIKISNGSVDTCTKWMDLNEESAKMIVETLIKEFNLKIS